MPGALRASTAQPRSMVPRLLELFELAGKKRTVLLGPGRAGHHMVYIDDLVGVRAMEADAVAGAAFIIAGPERSSPNEPTAILARVPGNPDPTDLRLPARPVRLSGHVCELLRRRLGIAPPIHRRRVDFIDDRAYDITKARRQLGFEPGMPLEEGLARTAAWYRTERLLGP